MSEEIDFISDLSQPDKHKHTHNRQIIDQSIPDDKILDHLLSIPKEQLIPWEDCYLPSDGLYYGWEDGRVSVRAMTQNSEKILATKRLAQTGQSVDHLFRDCCKFPDNFDPSQLLIGDRVFLLYFLRGITHGNMYEYVITCPNTDCGKTSAQQYDLNNLATTAKRANHNLGREPFRISLPYLSDTTSRDFWVDVRFLRSSDLTDMLIRNKAINKTSVDLDENIGRTIVSVMGTTDKFKIRSFVQSLHAKDVATIRMWYKDNTPGIDTTVNVTCPHCSGTFRMELPITESFFRQS